MKVTNIHILDLYPDEGLIEGFVKNRGLSFYAVLEPISDEITFYELPLEDSEDGETLDMRLTQKDEIILKNILKKGIV